MLPVFDPRIQYALAADGAGIAFWRAGDGLPVLHMSPIPWSHLELELRDPAYRAWFERIASVCQLARFDNRGSGLSERDIAIADPRDFMRDIDAVTAKLGWERFALMGICQSGPVAIAYAAEHPERVSHLVLWCSWPHAAPIQTPQMQALALLAERDFPLFCETVAHAMVAGWGASAEARSFAAIMREAIAPERAPDLGRATKDMDVTPILGRVQCPALVLQRRNTQLFDSSVARRLAAGIPGAELVMLDGEALLPYVGDVESVHGAIDDFLGVAPSSPAARSGLSTAPGLRTILFTDLEGHTGMMSRLGDVRGREVLREHERLTREALRHHGGSEVKTLGDGFIASFPSAQRALECAVALQHSFDQFNQQRLQADPSWPGLQLRIGVNAGEPVAEDDDLFGAAVIACARIAGQARGGEILVADVVRQLVAGKNFLFSDRGDAILRGLEDPVRLWDLRRPPN
jgi:class 3 adenylate cyclase/pimeloyl-ACP methyl ester carboxylesterase